LTEGPGSAVLDPEAGCHRRGYRVFVGSFRDQKVDFTAIKRDELRYYQVSMTVLAEETYEREVRPLKGVRDSYPKTILTLDRFGLGNDEGIKVVNLIDWLLERGFPEWPDVLDVFWVRCCIHVPAPYG